MVATIQKSETFHSPRVDVDSRQEEPIGRRLGLAVIMAVVMPAMLLLEAWNSRSWRYKHWVLTIFVTVYGSVIYLAVSADGRTAADGWTHLQHVHLYYVGMDFATYIRELGYIMTFRIGEFDFVRDPYIHTVAYLTGGVLGTPRLFFVIIAFVYGYFFSGSVLHVLRYFSASPKSLLIIGFVVVFLLSKNVEGVNTVRTWTGMWILVYACLKYHQSRRLRYLLLMFVPPFIHFGFFLMAIPAWAVVVFGSRPLTYSVLFGLSIFMSLINPGDVSSRIAQTERGESHLDHYLVEERRGGNIIQNFQNSRARGDRPWRTARVIGVHRWALYVFVGSILVSGIYFSVMNGYQKLVFSTGLLTLTFSNSFWFLFAVSNRSWLVGVILVLAAFLMARLDPDTSRSTMRQVARYKWWFHLSLLLFVPNILFSVSHLMDYVSVFVFSLPFLVWLDPELNMSVKEFLQLLLGMRGSR